jgi:pimeloyl-ACP methyl ester carboxylesterase
MVAGRDPPDTITIGLVSTHRRLRTSIVVLMAICAGSALTPFCQEATSPAFPQTGAPHPDGERRFLRIGDVRLQYVYWGGRGEALIFIPGGCDSAFVFGDAAQRLAQHFRVLGLTARGCGASDRPAAGYDMAHQTDDILGFMNAMGIDRATLLGHSSGGGKVTQFAHRHPERVNRLIYLDTVYAYIAPGLEEKMNAAIEKMLGGNVMDSVANWKKSASIWEPGVSSSAMDRDFEESFTVGPDGRVKERYATPPGWRKEVDPDMNAGLYTDAHITQPALMIFAMDTDHDRAQQLPPQARRELEPLIHLTDEHRREEIEKFRSNGANVHIVELRHTAHYCFVQRPATISQLITSFLMSPAS